MLSKRRLAWVAVALGGFITFVTLLDSVANPKPAYSVHGLPYNDFVGLLKLYDMEILCVLAAAALFIGGAYLAAPWIRKMLE